MFFQPKRFISAGTVSFLYFSCIRLIMPFSFLPNLYLAKPLLIERGAAALASAHTGPVSQCIVADAGVLSAISANHLDVRSVHRAFFFHDAALDIFCRVRPGMPLDDIGMLDEDGGLLRIDRQHAPALAPLAAAQYPTVTALATPEVVSLY